MNPVFFKVWLYVSVEQLQQYARMKQLKPTNALQRSEVFCVH